jgi:hypothetical protein
LINNGELSTSITSAVLEIGGDARTNDGNGLALSIRGATSDFRIYEQGGHGRVAQTWNAYWDDSTDTWKSIVGGEPHSFVGIGNITPGGTSGGNIYLTTSGSNTNAGDIISWNTGLIIETSGNVGIGTTSPT